MRPISFSDLVFYEDDSAYLSRLLFLIADTGEIE